MKKETTVKELQRMKVDKQRTERELRVVKVAAGYAFEVKTINQRLIKTPPIFEKDWTTMTSKDKGVAQFPNGTGFVAGNLDDRLAIWGGVQKQGDGRLFVLPKDVVFTHAFRRGVSGEILEGSWEVTPATGQVHPGYILAASAVHDHMIYINRYSLHSHRQRRIS